MGSTLSYFSSPSPLPLTSPSSPPEIKYDVFLSFRGEDTRNNFTSHLNKAFRGKGIDTFIDEDRLNRGDEISPSLLQAIEESQISVVIFSANYASSRWCLEELVKILECKKNHGQIVIPVFYEIDPSHVRHQTGSYAVAFTGHRRRFKKDLDKVQKWRCALTEAANLSGFDSFAIKSEAVLLDKIVEDVLKRLNNMSSSDNKQLIGIESKITKIEEMLRMGDQTNDDVRKVGICGIGGIGKTTLAKAIFDKIYCQFERFYFIDSIREALEKKELNRLRENLYSAILGDNNSYTYIFSKKRLHRKKLLIVLDDVTSSQQIEDLIGDLDHCCGSGSRFIITSRDRQALQNCKVEVEDIYMVVELCSNDALKLFCQHAFKQNRPKVEYKKLSKGVVKKVGGVPLALKVLGCFLFDKKIEVWESSMKRLENVLDKDIHKVLKISFDGLDHDQKRVFLDIACFYKGWDVNLVIEIMDASGFCTIYELSALEDKCLIIKLDNKIMMHDLLQAMGKEIVRQESTDPGERTRLFNHDDIYGVLTKATGTKNIEGVSLDMSNIRDILLHRDAFVNMPNLRFLRFYIKHYWTDWRDNNIRRVYNNKVHVPPDLEFLLTELKYFEWKRCPLKSLSSNLHLENLVILKFSESNLGQLWCDFQQFDNLKEIDLDSSQKLIRFPDLRAPKLERLNLDDCIHLIEMPSSFQHLTRLMYLSLYQCKNLTSVPQLPKSLEYVAVGGCSKLQRLPELPNNLVEINVKWCSSLIEIPLSIQHLTRLDFLNFICCQSLTRIPDCSGLMSLRSLELSYCSKLERLPEIPNNLEELNLACCTSLLEFPSSFQHLSKLERLHCRCCKSLTSIPDLTGLKSLTHLDILSSPILQRLPELPNNIQELDLLATPIEEWPSSLLSPSIDFVHNLRYLRLKECGITEIPDGVCYLTSLVVLDLERNNFERIPESIINLSKLRHLNISYCERLKVLPKLPWANINAANCTSLQELSGPSFPDDLFALNDSRFVSVNFVNCFKLDRNLLNSFVKDIHRKIQAQSPTYRPVYEGEQPPLCMWYPGSEILEWFDFQSTGSFIDVKLPLDWIDYNFICFALCAVVNEQDQLDMIEYKCSVKSKEGGHNWERMCGFLNTFWESAECSHVIIGSGFHFFPELHDNVFTFQFDSHVEKCGFHLIFGAHLKKSDQNEEVDEPHPKRLKHI